MNKRELDLKLSKMRSTIVIIENRMNEIVKVKGNDFNELNPVFVRNIVYVNSIIDKISVNMTEIVKHKNLNEENKEEIKKKSNVSMYLLKYLLDVTKTYSVEENDFEVYNLILRKNNLPNVLVNIPKKYQEVINEEFEDLSKNRKVIEGFNLSGITNIFKKIAGGFRSIIGILAQIGRFIGGLLVNFIKLFFKLLQFLFNLVFKIIPKLLKQTFFFLKNLTFKFAKVGPFALLCTGGILVGSTKFWQYVLEMTSPPPALCIIPALAVGWHLFWNETKNLYKLQMLILWNIFNFFTGPLKDFICFLFGFNPNDRFFRYRRGKSLNAKQFLVKFAYFIAMLTNNLTTFLVRFMLVTLAVKYGYENGVLMILKEGIPNIRDLLLWPIVIIRVLFQLMYGIIFPVPQEE